MSEQSSEDEASSRCLGCFDPECHNDAEYIARDEMVACSVAFCDDCWPEWNAKDHITEVET